MKAFIFYFNPRESAPIYVSKETVTRYIFPADVETPRCDVSTIYYSRRRAELEVEQGGLHVAVVAAHDAEALGEGGAVIARGHAFVEVVDEREARVMQHGCFASSRGYTSRSQRRSGSGDHRHGMVAAGEESLVADEHPLAEAAPRKVFGGSRRRIRRKWPSRSTMAVRP